MRIKELMELNMSRDGKIPNVVQETLPPTLTAPDMDQYYEYYRFLVSLAGWPEESNIPSNGPISDGPYIAPYTPQEHEHTIAILKKMGKKIRHVTSKPSIEPDWVNKSSPVRKFEDLDR